MKKEWLKREGNRRLILIFGGWSTDPRFYRDIDVEGWDTLLLYSFDGTENVLGLGFSEYDSIYLYAWSLGVFHAARLISGEKVTAAFAIAGTESPVDDLRGIPEQIFRTTRERLDRKNLDRFWLRMFGNRDAFLKASDRFAPEPDIERLKEELLAVERQGKIAPAAFWNRVYIFADDNIFPAENQRIAWENHPSGCEICFRRGSHVPDFAGLIKNSIPNVQAIARKFEASLPTYDSNAIAQIEIAQHTAELLARLRPRSGGKMCEIGQGSGLSTRAFAQVVNPQEIVCVDLYPTPQVKTGADMKYVVADGEEWIKSEDTGFDYIVSSSALQWFADLRGALRRFAEVLTPGGVIACATFAPGNLSEFDDLRPSPMRYTSAADLEKWLNECFDEVRVMEEEIRVPFDSPREALMHLRLTGVGGFSNHSLRIAELSAAVPKDKEGRYYLTYRPLYFTARSRK